MPMKVQIEAARRWIVRACTPSDAGWAGAAWGLIGLWLVFILSFVLHDVLPDFAIGKAAGLMAMLGALAFAGLGALLTLRLLNLLRPGYRLGLALTVPPLVVLLMAVWDLKGAVIATALLALGISFTVGAGADREADS
jgi:uncharacterized membrane protein